MFKQAMTLVDCLDILQKSCNFPLAVLDDKVYLLSKQSSKILQFSHIFNDRYYYKDGSGNLYCLCQKLPELPTFTNTKTYYISETLQKTLLSEYQEQVENKQYPV